VRQERGGSSSHGVKETFMMYVAQQIGAEAGFTTPPGDHGFSQSAVSLDVPWRRSSQSEVQYFESTKC
jgi:hypothetical protein